MGVHFGIRVGTSAFTAAGWAGTFYPEGMKPTDYLTYYATKFNTVEMDSTFYRTLLSQRSVAGKKNGSSTAAPGLRRGVFNLRLSVGRECRTAIRKALRHFLTCLTA